MLLLSQTDLICLNSKMPSIAFTIQSDTVLNAIKHGPITVCMLYFSGDDGSIVEDSEFPNVMFLMHKWYTSSEDLAQCFIELYPLLRTK